MKPTCLVQTWQVTFCIVASLTASIFEATAIAADRSPKQWVLADFEDAETNKRDAIQSEAVLIKTDDGQALQITTQADASWPGVLIEPRAGKWDLSAFDAVHMDVFNPQDVPVRVLLNINNPESDGRKNCNTESVTVAARDRVTLTVPFGNWHGEAGHPLDQSNVISVMVMLDRPGRSHCFVVDNIRAVPFDDRRMDEIAVDPFFQQLKPVFGRGVNLGNALEAPREGEWGVRLEKEYFDLIKSAGFDSVRIPVRWSAHAESASPYRIDPQFLARVDWAVRQALQRRLFVVMNVHHYGEIMEKPDEHRDRFLALWAQIAEHFHDRPPALSFELLNEPHGNLTAEKWNDLVSAALPVVRRTNPNRPIVVGPADWNGIGQLKNLRLPEEDRNLVVTIHYYSPFKFTHQGASWVGGQSQAWLGTRWLGTKAEQRAVTRDLDAAITWAVKHRRPIYMGEFGAYSKADIDSRARWTRFVADEAIRRNIGFGYWEFCSGFGVYDAQQRQWVRPLKEALLGQ
jgi:endoglucanase